MMTAYRTNVVALLALAAAVVPALASAHHSYASFEMDKTIVIVGTVSGWEWTNPHSFLYVDAIDEHGEVHNWRIESVSPVMAAKAGFTRRSFLVGDKVTVTAHPGKAGEPYRANLIGAKLPNGKELTMGFAPDSAPAPATQPIPAADSGPKQ